MENPVDFGWLGLPKASGEVDDTNSRKLDLHFESKFEAGGVTIEPERRNSFQVAALCICYGRYLASICYGPKSYLVDHINHLLNAWACSCFEGFRTPIQRNFSRLQQYRQSHRLKFITAEWYYWSTPARKFHLWFCCYYSWWLCLIDCFPFSDQDRFIHEVS